MDPCVPEDGGPEGGVVHVCVPAGRDVDGGGGAWDGARWCGVCRGGGLEEEHLAVVVQGGGVGECVPA